MRKKGKRRKTKDPLSKDMLMGKDVPVAGIGKTPAGGGKFPLAPYGKAARFPVNKFKGA